MLQDKVYTEIGKAIALIQLTDQVFKSVLLLVFPGQEFNDLDVLQTNNKVLDKATLGKLILVLSKRVTLNSNFKDILTKYRSDRNSLIHNWNEIEGWNEEEKAIEFIISVQKSAAFLTYTFVGFMRSWMEQVNITEIDKKHPEVENFFITIDSDWKYLINEFIEDVKIT